MTLNIYSSEVTAHESANIFGYRSDLDVATADEAHATLAKLPLVEADLLTFDYFPVGPFAPLASLIGRE